MACNFDISAHFLLFVEANGNEITSRVKLVSVSKINFDI